MSAVPDVSSDPVRVLTVGHGVASQPELRQLLADAGVEHLVDVRRFPSSRRNPHVNRGNLERWWPVQGIGYRWEERLGGRRDPVKGSPHTALTDEAIRAYADHMGSEAFAAGVGELVHAARAKAAAVMCAESSWRHCHRRLIADHLTLLVGAEVHHLDHAGELEPHEPTAEARVEEQQLIYDAGAPTLGLDV